MALWGVKANPSRWVVLDVETTGLDPARDQLLSIAAVALHREGEQWALCAGDAFEVRVQPERPHERDKHNVLVHGIGFGEQAASTAPAQALREFTVWLADSPWMGYHAPFDWAFLRRQCRESGFQPPANPWLDLRDLTEEMGLNLANPSLDDCLAQANIQMFKRHDAMADAWATAELWLTLWPRLRAKGLNEWSQIHRAARHRRWLHRLSR